MYRFLITPRWLGYLALSLAAAAVMAMLGSWQFDRYEERSAINDRIDAAATGEPEPLRTVLPTPTDRVEPDDTWRMVTVTGRYDPANQLVVRLRTLEGRTGFEIVTPLVLDDGSAVLVDRGWLPPDPEQPTAVPAVPAAPAGTVTVVGRVRAPESRAGEVRRNGGQLEGRRIAPASLADHVPYPLYGGYLTEEPARDGLATIEPRRENAWQNGGYTIQWYLLAVLTLVGFGYLARKEAHPRSARTESIVSASAADLSSR